MFPLPITTYVKIGILVVAVLGAFAYGWHTRDVDFSNYKTEIKVAAEKQQAEVESIKKQHELATKGIQDEYDAKLSLLRQYYANGVRNTGASTMPGISSTSKLSDAIAAYNVLAGQCAQTTLQVVEWQKWYDQVKKASVE